MGCYGKMIVMLRRKKDNRPYMCNNLCCKIASENRTLFPHVLCGSERNTLSLNQFSNLISKYFCKTQAN